MPSFLKLDFKIKYSDLALFYLFFKLTPGFLNGSEIYKECNSKSFEKEDFI